MRRFFVALLVVLTVAFAYAGGRAEVDPAARFEARFPNVTWDEVVAEARGSELYWYMWGGADTINRFVQGYVTDRLRDEYGVELIVVPVTDASVFVSKVVGERQAGRVTNGSVDAMWINGENFRSMRENDLLFGPYAQLLPNMRYVDPDDASVAYDFGFPVDGYESPYGSAQMVMIYDEARTPVPPRSIPALFDWIRANPGRFTYPAPPDFTGSVFLRHLFYSVAGGYEDLLGDFDQALFDEVAPRLWALLNEIEPYLWREGRTYPETITQQKNLFANREIDFDMDYNPGTAANLIADGLYPATARTFVFEEGSIGSTHYLAIPFNATNKAAALVLANLVLDPALQLEKSKPEVWGDLPVIDISRVEPDWRRAFAALPTPPSILTVDELQTARIPELQTEWLDAIERGWIAFVLQQ